MHHLIRRTDTCSGLSYEVDENSQRVHGSFPHPRRAGAVNHASTRSFQLCYYKPTGFPGSEIWIGRVVPSNDLGTRNLRHHLPVTSEAARLITEVILEISTSSTDVVGRRLVHRGKAYSTTQRCYYPALSNFTGVSISYEKSSQRH
jgi:hypothetical protein